MAKTLKNRNNLTLLVFLCVTALIGGLSVNVTATSPLKTTCLQINNQPFTVEVALTPEEQQRGLQHRKHLAADKGMAFPYESAQILSFWMKDCHIPLDILFFKDDTLVDYVDSVPPCQVESSQCPIYTSKVPANMVVELKSGTRRRYDLTIGSSLSLCVKPTPETGK